MPAIITFPKSAICLFPGVVAASVGLFGSLALQVAGPIPLALERLGQTGLKPAERVRIFVLCFKRVAPIMIGVGFVCGSLALFPTFAYPNLDSQTHLRLSAAAFLAVTPYTLLTLANINNALLTLNRTIRTSEEGDLSLTEDEGKRGVRLMENWSFWAAWRTVLLSVGWVEMVIGLGKELRVIYRDVSCIV